MVPSVHHTARQHRVPVHGEAIAVELLTDLISKGQRAYYDYPLEQVIYYRLDGFHLATDIDLYEADHVRHLHDVILRLNLRLETGWLRWRVLEVFEY